MSPLEGLVSKPASTGSEPIIEITRMLDAQRAYVEAQNFVQTQHNLQMDAIDKLTRSA